jgi:hypothetical protein
MKHLTLLLASLLLLSLACSLSGEGQETPPVSQGKCGDGICDGPENAQNCPEDCQAGVGDSAGEASVPKDDQEDKKGTSVPAAGDQAALGWVSCHVVLDRQMGLGDCGVDPWKTDVCMDVEGMAASKWWGQHLKVFALTSVLIVPDGPDRWLITNHADTVSQYGYSAASFEPDQASYQEASIDFSITPECSGNILGEDFDFHVTGTHDGGQLTLTFSANPQERIDGQCAGNTFTQNPSHLLYGWAAALSGDPYDLTGVLSQDDRLDPGSYSHSYVTDTHPSPENRDHVEVELSFQCIKSLESQVSEPIPCPWEQ